MHYIAADLDGDDWLSGWARDGLTRFEQYLARWRAFSELYPDDAAVEAE